MFKVRLGPSTNAANTFKVNKFKQRNVFINAYSLVRILRNVYFPNNIKSLGLGNEHN